MKYNKIIVSVLFLFLIVFFVSSVIAISISSSPKIIKTYPRDNSNDVISEKEFKIRFRESNPIAVELHYKNILDNEYIVEAFNLSDIVECQHKTNNEEVWECDKQANVNDGEIEFFFKVKNSINEINSEVSRARFDSITPNLSVASPEADDVLSDFFIFSGSVDEKSKVWYEMDNEKKHRICSKCNYFDKEIRIPSGESRGIHRINIFAKDEAGNVAKETRRIFII